MKNTHAIDENYHTLRRMHFSEQAPTLSYILASDTAFVLPSKASEAEQRAWLKLARALQRRFQELQIISDDEELSSKNNLVIVGKRNTHFDHVMKINQRDDFTYTDE